MKKLLFLVFFFNPISVFGQNDSLLFENLFNHFQETFIWTGQNLHQERDSVTWNSLYKTPLFNVSISEKPIHFETNQRILKNPFFTEDLDDYDDNYIIYPVSYSVIYADKLISLFRNGWFVVYDLEGFERDIVFENKLNTKKFSYHWLIDGKLYALNKNWLNTRLFVWSEGEWKKARISIPIKNQPLLFDDEKYIVFNDCFGEWGGTVYFYDRETEDIYFTESTCTNTVFRDKEQYSVLSHLGHGFGSSELKYINEPRNLSKAKKSEINKTKKGEALGYSDKSNNYNIPLDLYFIQLFSTFSYNGRQLFITRVNELTFLSEIQDSEIQIVHPLYDNALYSHHPITKVYGNYILINIDHWGTARDREISVIIINQNKITKLDWD